ncbi:hypothetical protein CROQUDRAFT_659726 [Cronartium quercuum f. sp. fusiforme G11]|uniref:Uncharacterized protein n=1 Tax=Cronartium quercuum f. sp. fusiforme G11 TaxID=708437 RepID=A0A9P6NJH0_9BASI|nr:hypothetical protein CROQUDRAFT_659726 [Cronartium quercuum f. sp. fusiforme G11]
MTQKLGSAFVGPEGAYSVILELNVQRVPADSSSNLLTLSNVIASTGLLSLNPSSSSNALVSGTNPAPSNQSLSTSSPSTTPNQGGTCPPPAASATPNVPPVYIPACPGVPANADGVNPSVAPPAYPSAMDSVLIRFPSSQPPNLFPHPGFLTGTKYGRPKDPNTATPDQLSSVELSSADHTDSDEPSSAQSSLATPIAPVTNVPEPPPRTSLSPMNTKTRGLNFGSGLSGTPRPRAAFRGSTSTFIKSSEGLPLANSVLKTLYSEVGEPDERALGFYTWNKSLFWTHLGRPTELARLNFQAYPTSVTVNPLTTSAGAMDVIVGFASGDLLYFDPFCARYSRLNKGGCVSASGVSKVVWAGQGRILSGHLDGTVIGWDKEREDFAGFICQPFPEKVERMVVSRIPTSMAPEKRARLNPVLHWRLSRKAVRDLALSPDLQHCAVVSEDGCLRIIDVAGERLLDTYVSYFGALSCVCWSSDGRLVFTGGQDDLVTVYSLLDKRVLARCQGHSSFVSGVAYDPWMSDERSSRFASVSEDCKLIFWDLSSASLSRPRLLPQHSSNSRRQSMTSTVSLPLHRRGEFHPAPGRNEVSILQPVMVKEMSTDPLSGIKFLKDRVVVVSRTGQVKVFSRPERVGNSVSASTKRGIFG